MVIELYQGNVWDVPMMPRPEWRQQGVLVWAKVERELLQGWAGKLKDGFRLAHGRDKLWYEGYGEEALVKAAELGAPVYQMFTACSLRERVP